MGTKHTLITSDYTNSVLGGHQPWCRNLCSQLGQPRIFRQKPDVTHNKLKGQIMPLVIVAIGNLVITPMIRFKMNGFIISSSWRLLLD